MNDAVKRMLEKYEANTWQGLERALKEVLQEITLVALWRANFFQQAAFHGGTALRILYGLDRFSEDLDFTLLRTDPHFRWEDISRTIIEEIGSYDFDVEVTEKKKNKDSNIQSAFLKANTLQSLINIGLKEENALGLHPEKSLRIKIEVDTHPTLGFEVEKQYIKEPFPVSISSVVKPDLFAAKLHAALFRAWKERVKGRDWYDVIWFISKNTPLNLNYFTICMRELNGVKDKETLTSAHVIDRVYQRIEHLDIEAAKQDVIPYLKKPMIIEEWSKAFFKHWIQQMEFC